MLYTTYININAQSYLYMCTDPLGMFSQVSKAADADEDLAVPVEKKTNFQELEVHIIIMLLAIDRDVYVVLEGRSLSVEGEAP